MRRAVDFPLSFPWTAETATCALQSNQRGLPKCGYQPAPLSADLSSCASFQSSGETLLSLRLFSCPAVLCTHFRRTVVYRGACSQAHHLPITEGSGLLFHRKELSLTRLVRLGAPLWQCRLQLHQQTLPRCRTTACRLRRSAVPLRLSSSLSSLSPFVSTRGGRQARH